jgi:hypothetical protein
MATTSSNVFVGNQTISGSIVPAVNGTYDLGSSTHEFRHLYLSSASLYIDGTKVLGSTTQELQITTDAGQSFKILEAGSDTITLQAADGNITLATSGGGDVILDPTTGVIALKGTTTIYAGNKVLSSDGNAIQFGNSVTMTGSLVVTGFIETQELRTTYISSSILYRSGSTKFGDELGDTHSFTGSLTVSGSISAPGSGLVSGSSQITYSGLSGIPSGIVSGSSQLPSGIVSSSAQTIANLPSGTVSGSVQVDVMSTTNIARLATTGSNTFTNNQIVSGSVTSVGTGTSASVRINNTTSTTGRDWHLYSLNNGNFGLYNNTNEVYSYQITPAGDVTFNLSLTAQSGYFNKPFATNGTSLIVRQTTAGGNGNQDIGLIVDIQGANDLDRILNLRYYNGSTYTSRFSVLRDGKVGVGYLTPTVALQVSGTIASGDGDGGWGRFLYDAGTVKIQASKNGTDAIGLSFWTQASGGTFSEKVNITGGGNVGVNDSNPSRRFAVNFGTSINDGLIVYGSQRQNTVFRSTGEHCFLYIDSFHNNIFLPVLHFQRSSTTFGSIGLNRASNGDALGSYVESEMLVGTDTDTPISLKVNNERIVIVNSSSMRVKSTILPTADATYNLGSTSLRWNHVYTTDLHLSNEGKQNVVDGTWGDWTLQEGENDIYMLNNRSGEKFKIKLEKIIE